MAKAKATELQKANLAESAGMAVDATGHVADLIRLHYAAWDLFQDSIRDNCDKTEERKVSKLSSAEEIAMNAVCAAPVRTLDDARMKADYLTRYLVHEEIIPSQLHLFFRSITSDPMIRTSKWY